MKLLAAFRDIHSCRRLLMRAFLVFGLSGSFLGLGGDPAAARNKSKHGEDARQQSEKPTGPFHIIVSIGSQRVALYSGKTLIARAPVSTGMSGHPTPTGVFSVIQKHKWHVSNIYSAAPMPYMQRITWSGIALHAGVLPGYPASHGCIRLPYSFAIRLWGLTKLGARVVVVRNEISPNDIEHPHLFAPKPAAAQVSPDAEAVKIAELPDNQSSPDVDRNQDVIGRAAVRQNMTATDAMADPHSDPPKTPNAAPPLRKSSPIAIFISRKEMRLYVRQSFKPLFDFPVTFENPDKPVGTHIYTAIDLADGGNVMHWVGMSMPAERSWKSAQLASSDLNLTIMTEPGQRMGRTTRSERRREKSIAVPQGPSASEALDRIVVPQEASDRIADLIMPGSSLIISDHGRGSETGEGTDFIVVTR
ncbi:MAG TPA: L,D-transpeptidase [Xanthobacteraceae bacterium]|jgi:hypothetical protein|nr:L,D-transpeptidase [Xanthobacteraceae bacterium]